MDEAIWSGLCPFESVSFVQRFLNQCYGQNGVEKAEAKSYRNSYPFLYYLQHGKAHYQLAQSAQTSLQPLLLFYGMSQLVKACLLTADPEYPKTTAVLAHGVSTRKKKKKDYAFVEDEVLIQKHGLAVHLASELFGLSQAEGNRWKMKSLLARLPDLNNLHQDLYGKPSFCPIQLCNNEWMEIPLDILDDLHMTASRFVEFLSKRMNLQALKWKETATCIRLLPSREMMDFPSSLEGQLYLPRNRNHFNDLPEMLVHFLLLYNLSMIARYETEWWSNLFHEASEDLPLIDKFLSVTKKKVPLLISRYLRNFM